MQNDGCVWYREPLVVAVVGVGSNARRVGLVQIEMDGALVRVPNQGGNSLRVMKNGGSHKLAEASQAFGQVVFVEDIEGLLRREEGLQNGNVLVGIRIAGNREKGEECVKHLQ